MSQHFTIWKENRKKAVERGRRAESYLVSNKRISTINKVCCSIDLRDENRDTKNHIRVEKVEKEGKHSIKKNRLFRRIKQLQHFFLSSSSDNDNNIFAIAFTASIQIATYNL